MSISIGKDKEAVVHIYNGIMLFVVVKLLICVWLFCDPMDCNLQAPLSTGFPRKDTGVGCHLLLQGNFPEPEIKPTSPALAGKFFTTEPPGKPQWNITQLLKKQNNAICSKMDGPRDHHTEWSQTQKDKHYIILLICGLQENKGTNEFIYKTEKELQV